MPGSDEQEQLQEEGDETNGIAPRASWGNRVEFILTCIGYAVGLGNVWRFPYLCYSNGGGAFLIPYFLALGFIGIPLFFLEMSFGQFASLGPIPIWKVGPIFKGLGWAMAIVSIYITTYYNVIVAWCLYYFFASMTPEPLPWAECGHWWNTEYCVDQHTNLSSVPDNVTVQTASEEYYYRQVLQISDGIDNMGAVRWQLALLLLLTWVTVFFVLIKGVSSLGKAAYFISLFPYLLLTIMLIRGVTLEGAAVGIEYYITPEWSRLAEAKVWGDAATQIFYSLGCCMGSIIAMSSFNKFHENTLRVSVLVPIINCCTSVYAGFVIFSVLGYMSVEKGVEVSEVATEGPGLVFVVYPEGLATMPFSPIWAVLFFFMMTTLGFSSQFSMVEGVIAGLMDEYPKLFRHGLRPLFLRAVFCIISFFLGLPMVTEGGFYLFTLVDAYCAGYPLLIVGLLELIALNWVYGFSRVSEDIALMMGKKPSWFWRICWCGLTPLLITITVIFKAVEESPMTLDVYVYPDWANAMAWCIVAFPLVTIVLVAIISWFMYGGWQVLKAAASPTPEWGPALAENRKGRYALVLEAPDEVKIMPSNVAWIHVATAVSMSTLPPKSDRSSELNKSSLDSVSNMARNSLKSGSDEQYQQRDDVSTPEVIPYQVPSTASQDISATTTAEELVTVSPPDGYSNAVYSTDKVEIHSSDSPDRSSIPGIVSVTAASVDAVDKADSPEGASVTDPTKGAGSSADVLTTTTRVEIDDSRDEPAVDKADSLEGASVTDPTKGAGSSGDVLATTTRVEIDDSRDEPAVDKADSLEGASVTDPTKGAGSSGDVLATTTRVEIDDSRDEPAVDQADSLEGASVTDPIKGAGSSADVLATTTRVEIDDSRDEPAVDKADSLEGASVTDPIKGAGSSADVLATTARVEIVDSGDEPADHTFLDDTGGKTNLDVSDLSASDSMATDKEAVVKRADSSANIPLTSNKDVTQDLPVSSVVTSDTIARPDGSETTRTDSNVTQDLPVSSAVTSDTIARPDGSETTRTDSNAEPEKSQSSDREETTVIPTEMVEVPLSAQKDNLQDESFKSTPDGDPTITDDQEKLQTVDETIGIINDAFEFNDYELETDEEESNYKL